MTECLDKALRDEFWILGGLDAAMPDLFWYARHTDMTRITPRRFVENLHKTAPYYFELGLEEMHYDSRRRIIENREREAAV